MSDSAYGFVSSSWQVYENPAFFHTHAIFELYFRCEVTASLSIWQGYMNGTGPTSSPAKKFKVIEASMSYQVVLKDYDLDPDVREFYAL